MGKTIALLIPARNEASALPQVLKAVPREIDWVLVLDNGSTDSTATLARIYGAETVWVPTPGYGRACLAGLKRLTHNPPGVVAFADADGSDDLSSLLDLVGPVAKEEADFTLAWRIPQHKNALSFQQRLGNWVVTRLIFLFWKHVYCDLGPMRAISWECLKELRMNDINYGWTVEMQIRALKNGLRIREFPTPYRERAGGRSKVSKTLAGSLRAGLKMLWVLGKEAFCAGSV